MKLFAKCHLVENKHCSHDNIGMRKNAKLPKIIGTRIARRRKQLKLTQEDLADKVRISRVYMGYIEQGRNAPTIETLEKIARALGVKPSTLIT